MCGSRIAELDPEVPGRFAEAHALLFAHIELTAEGRKETFLIGRTLGPYSITAKLGEGGMGEVWRARDTRLEREEGSHRYPTFIEDRGVAFLVLGAAAASGVGAEAGNRRTAGDLETVPVEL